MKATGAETAAAIENDLLAGCLALQPDLSAGAAQTEARRSLAPASVEAVRNAGLFRIFKPRRYGGFELDWGAQIRAGRIIARVCPSTAWIVSVVGSHAGYLARLSEAAQDDVWADGDDVIIATGSAPTGAHGQPVEGGYRVNGQWRFCSGVDYAAWVLLATPVEADSPNAMRFMLIPRSDFEILDDWQVSGMSGTGSKSTLVENAFVPAHRTIALDTFFRPDPPGAAVNSGGVYSIDFRVYAGTAMLGPIVGAAEGALSEVTGWISSRASGEIMSPDDTSTQLMVAESQAEIATAVTLLDGLLSLQSRIASSEADASDDDRLTLLRDRTFASRLCVRAIERLVNALDAESILSDAPVQRLYRDLAAMSQQIGINWDRNMGSCGQKLLGLPSDDAYLNEGSAAK